MKSREVLQLLNITRPTLTKYVKEGIIKTITLPNGRYDYDQESVYGLFYKGVTRKGYIYVKDQDVNSINSLKQYCLTNDLEVAQILQDDTYTNTSLHKLIDQVLQKKVEKIITYSSCVSEDVLSVLEFICNKFNTEIVFV